MTTKPFPAIDLTTASACALAAGTASDYAIRAFSDGQRVTGEALNKLSLRFAELALEALGGEPGQGTRDESPRA
jgi:hypothetical protein